MGTLTPLMGKHGIVVFQNEEGREMFDDGKGDRSALPLHHRPQVWRDLAGTDPADRPVELPQHQGWLDDKSLNKCHTAARKYFLLSLFQNPHRGR